MVSYPRGAGASNDVTTSPTNKSPKSIRKIFSKTKKGKLTSTDLRVDGATGRQHGGGCRDPPDSSAVYESEICKFNDKGNEFFGKADYDAALRMYSEALKLLKSSNIVLMQIDENEGDKGEELMSDPMRRVRTARCLVNVGAVHIRRGDFDDAMTALELSMRQSDLVKVSSPHYRRAHETMTDALENLGLILFKKKDYAKGSEMYTSALVGRRKCLELLNAEHSKTKRKKKKKATNKSQEARKEKAERDASLLELAVTLFYMALLCEKTGEIDNAVTYCEEALSIRREVIPDPKMDTHSLNIFTAMSRLYLHDDIKRYKAALPYCHGVHLMKCELVGKNHLDVVPSLNSIAFIYNQCDEYKKSAVVSDRAIDIASNGRGLNKETCVAYTNKGDSHKALEEYELAISSYESAINIQSRCLEKYDTMNATAYEKLAESYGLANEAEKAISSMERCIALKRHVLGPDNEEVARSYSKLGEYYHKAGEHTNGIKCHTRALRIFKHIRNTKTNTIANDTDEQHPAMVSTTQIAVEHNRIATILKSSGETNKAMEHYMASLWHSREARLPSTDPIVADTIKNVAGFQKS